MKRLVAALLTTLVASACLAVGWATPASAATVVDIYPGQSVGAVAFGMTDGGTIRVHTGTYSAFYIGNYQPTSPLLVTAVDGPVTFPSIGLLNVSNVKLSGFTSNALADCNNCTNVELDAMNISRFRALNAVSNVSVKNSVLTGDGAAETIDVPNFNTDPYGNGLIISDNVISGGTLGIRMARTNNVSILRNRISTISSGAGGSSGMALYSLTNSVIDSNVIVSSAASSVGIYTSGPTRNTNLAITNNVVLAPGGAGFVVADADNLTFANNTVRGGGWWQLLQLQGTVNGSVINNLGPGLAVSGFTGLMDYNCVQFDGFQGPNGIVTPINVDANGKPNPGHPCIAKGLKAGSPAVSINNVTRPGVVDVGAWQVTLLSGSGTATVSAQVLPTATLTIAGASSCNAVNNSAGATSSPSAVSLGHITAGQNSTASQQVTAATNAANGFILTSKSNGPLQNVRGDVLDFDTMASHAGGSFAWTDFNPAGQTISSSSVGQVTYPSCVGYRASSDYLSVAGTYSVVVTYSLVPSF